MSADFIESPIQALSLEVEANPSQLSPLELERERIKTIEISLRDKLREAALEGERQCDIVYDLPLHGDVYVNPSFLD